MKILHVPNTVLNAVAEPVEKIDKEIISLIQEMIPTLLNHKDPEGVGLAAPQVGVSKRIFIMRPNKKAELTVHINPEIVDVGPLKTYSEEERRSLEGCLSIPKLWGIVDRAKWVRLTWMDEKGETHTKKFDGFAAHVIQHEMDHLNGILYTQRVLEQDNVLYKEKDGEFVRYEI